MNKMIYFIGYKYYLLLIYELTSSHSFKWKIIEINKNVLEVNHGIRREYIIAYSMHIENYIAHNVDFFNDSYSLFINYDK